MEPGGGIPASAPSHALDAARPTGTPPARLHWIDWLRALAIAGVFLYHTLRPFNTDGWHVKNAEQSELLGGLTTFFASFGLAVLFLLAGAGVRFALRKRSWRAFIGERTLRLVVPFVVGTLLLGPVQGFLQAVQQDGYGGTYVDYVGLWASRLPGDLVDDVAPTVFGVGYHLWFLGFLFAISLIALPLCVWLVSERGRRLVDALARWLDWPGATLTVAIPIYAAMGIAAPLGMDEHDWFEFAWYFAYFMVGFVLVSDERFLRGVRRDLWPAAVVAAATTTLIAAGIPIPLDQVGDQGFDLAWLAMGALFAAEGWAWTLIVLNVGMRLRALGQPLGETVGAGVLPLYVVHQPVILAVAFMVVSWPVGILPKWLVVVGVSLPISLALVWVALRIPLARTLLGVRARPPLQATPVPMPGLGAAPPPAPAHHG